MIKLPDDFLDSAYVRSDKAMVILHFVNSAQQYFTHVYLLDKAYSWDQHMTRLKELQTFPDKQAYVLHRDLTTVHVEPSTQDWMPAALPADGVMSFKQYEAHMRLAAQEDAANAG